MNAALAINRKPLTAVRDRGTALAFDFGEKRIGVAVGDLKLRIAHPLVTVDALENGRRFAAIAGLIAEWQPVLLVVGTPSLGSDRVSDQEPLHIPAGGGTEAGRHRQHKTQTDTPPSAPPYPRRTSAAAQSGKDDSNKKLAPLCRKFANRLRARFGIPVILVDESHSSNAASLQLDDAGVRGRKQKTVLDRVAAQQILQTYFSTMIDNSQTASREG